MRIYAGQAVSAETRERRDRLGLGEMTQPGQFPPRVTPWALDNGAYRLWKAGKAFNEKRFWKTVRQAAEHDVPPDFVVCPDVVAGGLASLALSVAWAQQLAPLGMPLALVVQDGMDETDVIPHLHHFNVLFIGGTLEWKLATMYVWVKVAHAHGLTAHVGRMGSGMRVQLARLANVDSIDSSSPLMSDAKAAAFGNALKKPIATVTIAVQRTRTIKEALQLAGTG